MYIRTVNPYSRPPKGTSKRWTLKTGGLYTEVLHCSGVDIVDSLIVVT